MTICVIGAGVIGVTTAYELARRGHQVTVVDANMEAGLETSFANGAQLSYNHVAPLADPAVIKKLAQLIFASDSALQFRPDFTLAQLSWSLSFLWACRRSVVERTLADLLSLSDRSRRSVHEIVEREGIEFDYTRNGKLVVYRDPTSFEVAKRMASTKAALGSREQVLSPEDCITLEPSLAPIAKHLAGGLFAPHDEAGDCLKFTQNLARICAERYGVEFIYNSRVTRLKVVGGRIVSATTIHGEISARSFILAAGTESVDLVRPLGIKLPIIPLYGYSLTQSIGVERISPVVSVTDADHKVVFTRIGDRLRAAGIVEIGGSKHSEKRVAQLIRCAKQTFPLLADFDEAIIWRGARPATARGRPIIGRSRISNLSLNVGHGMLGFTLACGSAALLADSLEMDGRLANAFRP